MRTRQKQVALTIRMYIFEESFSRMVVTVFVTLRIKWEMRKPIDL